VATRDRDDELSAFFRAAGQVGADDRLLAFAFWARHFLDWARLWAPLGDDPSPAGWYSGAQAKFFPLITVEAAIDAQAAMASFGLLLDEWRSDTLIRAAFPAYAGFRAPFLTLLVDWGFRSGEAPGYPPPFYYAPPADEAPDVLSVSPTLLAAMDGAVAILERLRDKHPRLAGYRVLVMTPAGPVRLAEAEWRTIRVDLAADPPTIAFRGASYPVKPAEADYVQALIDLGGIGTSAEMQERYPAHLGPEANMTRIKESLPPPIRNMIVKADGVRFLGGV